MHQHATHDVQNASTRNTWRSKCITTQHTQHMRNTIENCKIEIGKHVSKLQCVNAEYACRAIIRKQLPGFESCRLWRLWWTFLVVAILAHAVTAAVKYDDDCPEVDRDISIRKRVCPKKHLKCLYRRSLSSLPVKALLKVVWTTLFRRTGAWFWHSGHCIVETQIRKIFEKTYLLCAQI